MPEVSAQVTGSSGESGQSRRVTRVLGTKKPVQVSGLPIDVRSTGRAKGNPKPGETVDLARKRMQTAESKELGAPCWEAQSGLGRDAQMPIMPAIRLRWMSEVPEYIKPQVASR